MLYSLATLRTQEPYFQNTESKGGTGITFLTMSDLTAKKNICIFCIIHTGSPVEAEILQVPLEE